MIQERVMALLKTKIPKDPVIMQDRLMKSYFEGYNACIADVVVLIEKMKTKKA